MDRRFAHGRNLRRGRHSERGRIYFITSCCHNKQRVFADPSLANLMCEAFEYEDRRNDSLSLAFVVMPDHVHWLLQIGEKWPLEQVVNSLKGRSARQINLARGARGKLWQGGFHDRALRKEEDLEAAADYLIHNPVRAGLVTRPNDYRFWMSVWHPNRVRA